MVLVVKNLPASSGDMRHEFSPWVGKIPWRRKGLPTPVFLPGESHEQRSLVGQSIGSQRVRHDWSDLAHMHTGEGAPGGGTHLGRQSGNLQGTNMSQ